MTSGPFQSEEAPPWSLPVTHLVAENTVTSPDQKTHTAQSPCLHGNDNILNIVISVRLLTSYSEPGVLHNFYFLHRSRVTNCRVPLWWDLHEKSCILRTPSVPFFLGLLVTL